ncbi:MAG: Gfo/Idh/MocA family oxidoreductase [Deltaproteobacteria bacterium]|nr:Gfo/Idh/MocA family oxidoreductase [Deltaproteobacteria bacterium]
MPALCSDVYEPNGEYISRNLLRVASINIARRERERVERMFNIGLIGTGNIANNRLAPAVAGAPGAQLWSVLSRDSSRADQFAERHNAQSPQPVFTNLEEMLSDTDLHGVIIATPDKLHAEQTIMSLQAGKHVLVEKPMSVDVESASAMVQAAREAGRCLAVAYHLRWHNGHRRMREEILRGDIGRLLHMRVLWTLKAPSGDNWRASSNVGQWWSMAAVGTHCLDLIRWFMCDACGQIESVKSTISSTVWNQPHDETALISLKFESGATAEMCSSVLFEAPHRVEIYGDRGYVICEGTLGAEGSGTITTHSGRVEFPVSDPFTGEVINFVESASKGIPPEVDAEEGLRNVELLTMAARESGLPYYAK